MKVLIFFYAILLINWKSENLRLWDNVLNFLKNYLGKSDFFTPDLEEYLG